MWIHFTPFSSVSIGDFEQVNVDWNKGHGILFAKNIVWEQYQDLNDIANSDANRHLISHSLSAKLQYMVCSRSYYFIFMAPK